MQFDAICIARRSGASLGFEKKMVCRERFSFDLE